MIYLLDSSAVLAHYLDEPGAAEVDSLLAGGSGQVFLAAPVWVELDRRLGELIGNERETERVFRHYTRDLCGLIILDEASTLSAIQIRKACPNRLPLVDALIAGCAASRSCTLVHRDLHLDGIPAKQLPMLRLPDKLVGE